jgi:hypothetical protein
MFIWWGGVVSIHSPFGTGFTDPLLKPSAFLPLYIIVNNALDLEKQNAASWQ